MYEFAKNFQKSKVIDSYFKSGTVFHFFPHFLIPLEVDLGLVPVFLPVDCFPCFFLFNQATILLN